MTDIVHVENLVKRYDDLIALDHFNLNIAPGEIFGLLGPNGSGKTTSINCILQLLAYDKGTIELFGEPMTPARYDLKRRIGVVPQQVAVFDELTVRENIDYFCSLYVNDRKRRRTLVDEAIDFVGLGDFTKFRPGKLSGGLARRLNIACGIAHKPELIFFDEPTVAVDPQSRNAILGGIGVVPQQVAVFDELTVRENIDYFCSLYVNDRKRRRTLVDEAIDFVGLGDFTKFRPGKLSGGLARRLNIACGIAHKPELIFFDEPTVAVDPQSRNAILGGICRLRDEGATVVYTSHYMEEVEQICSRIMIMDGGRVLAQGTNDELKRMIQMGEKIVIEVGEVPSAALAAVASLPHVLDLAATAGQLTFSCEASPHNLTDILDVLRSHDVPLGRIYSEPPTLNDVFLEITGRELRD